MQRLNSDRRATGMLKRFGECPQGQQPSIAVMVRSSGPRQKLPGKNVSLGIQLHEKPSLGGAIGMNKALPICSRIYRRKTVEPPCRMFLHRIEIGPKCRCPPLRRQKRLGSGSQRRSNGVWHAADDQRRQRGPKDPSQKSLSVYGHHIHVTSPFMPQYTAEGGLHAGGEFLGRTPATTRNDAL